MFPHLLSFKPGTSLVNNLFALVPKAGITISVCIINSEPGIGTGRLLPEESGSPNSIFIHFIAFTQPFSLPTISTGFVSKLKIIPSSFALLISSIRAGISAYDLR
jgi:hypothetical protein